MIAAIGVFDSGTCGLGVLKALRAALPLEEFIYLADNGDAPYGERDMKRLISYRFNSWWRRYDVGLKPKTCSKNTLSCLRRRYPRQRCVPRAWRKCA